MKRPICLHCGQPAPETLCPDCRSKGHSAPLEDCDLCPYKRTRQALQKKPAKTKPARGQQSLFPSTPLA